MGRLQPSAGQPPASFRRAARAKRAKTTLNTLIPSLLAAHPRARRGIEAAELILAPPRAPPPPPTSSSSPPRLALQVADTLRAARALTTRIPGTTTPRIAILNMASPLHPGGGFLTGASSQEESLCMRTTLLPSLDDAHYRLPDLGAIYTPDVLVFREGEEDVLEKRDRWFVDVVTAAMPRNPETKQDEDGFAAYSDPKDRELIVAKMRMVMRLCQSRGVDGVILGAWGCGAYGNPVGEVARAWRKVLLPRAGGKKKPETWDGISEVVLAIKDAGMAAAFSEAFGKGLEEEDATGQKDDEEEDESEEDQELSSLRTRIDQLRLRVHKAPSLQLKQGLAAVLAGLESQLPENTPC
ncbi:hypothetical protein F5X68DRAFT_166930 [Plectosphaerella plurivora]|uniref:Microbial-type PARG catalytic domain-containing protein n=1 Tax=Plectosphaerella plurivora TaxID=936078 RepID=A0A9P8VEK7_9PEZI|nr:hypothetical protein F5X68DRAFT_166930 [Plectosphaerella plurivora]